MLEDMKSRKIIVAVILTLALLGVAEGVTRVIPPYFREYPNVVAQTEVRADENVNYRLPNDTEPIHYDIELTTNVHTGARLFTGTVKIELSVLANTNTVVLHARQLSDFVANMKKKDSVDAAIEMRTTYNTSQEFLILTPKDPNTKFLKNTIWILTVEYKGELRTDNGGFYISSYRDDKKDIRYLATTQFESTNARHGFPCYDEPAKRATFTISIKHHKDYQAISNMPVDDEKSKEGLTVFNKTVKQSTYLIAFIVSDFKGSSSALNGLPHRVFSRPGTEDEREWALISSMLIIERLGEYYGVRFELPKLDQVAIPDFNAGAMENYGLVTYREAFLLYDKHTSTIFTQTNIAHIIAHEYAHQWFGNYVAIKWWSYLWLKEGFATLFSYRATDDAYPEWGIYQMYHANDYISALEYDGYKSPRPMTLYVQTPEEISSLYDSVSYAKAGSVLLMWQHALTDKVFRRGLNKYLTVNKFSAADEEQLFEAIQIASKEENHAIPASISEMMSTWTRQGGFPLLTVERNYENGSFVIKQEAFCIDETYKQNKSWYVPFNYAHQLKPDFRNTEATHYLENVTELLVNVKGLTKTEWLILNKQSTGYYRINYDSKNWQLIADGLNKETHKIHPRNRAQLLNDAYTFVKSKRLSHDILLNLMTYLRQEDQYAPWAIARNIITTFDLYLSGDTDYNNFKFFVGELVQNIYDRLGVDDVPGEHHFQKYTRSLAINLACLAGIKNCLEETNNKLKALISEGVPIEPNLQPTTYCNGLKKASDNEFNFVFEKLMKSDDQANRQELIAALGCMQNRTLIHQFFASSIDKSNSLYDEERRTLLRAGYSEGSAGLESAIEFLNENWQQYAELPLGFYNNNPLDDDIRTMSTYVVNTDQEKKILDLVDKVKDSEKVTKTLEQGVKSNIKSNFEWLEDNRAPLMSWMRSFHLKSAGTTLTTTSLTLSLIMAVALRYFL